MRVIVVAGTCRGVGKSCIALGLMAAYTRRGLHVQPFKIGPDFLDPMLHEAATGHECFNLDTWMMSREVNLAFFSRCAADADLAIVEGVMGLFDGVDGKSEAGSTGEIAKLLNASVLLVVDSRGLARSAAALVRGYITFDPELKFAGIIFNKIEAPTHKGWLVDAVSSSDESVKVLGGVPRVDGLELSEDEFLSNLQSDRTAPSSCVKRFSDLVEHYVDLDRLLEAASSYEPASTPTSDWEQLHSCISLYPHSKQVRIGVAKDAAFCLYYRGNLALLQEAGAELIYFSPLKDLLPARLDAIYLGDGYPENHLEQLSLNKPMLYAIRAFAEAGGIVYGESAGLAYLSQGVEGQDHKLFNMVGVFPFWTRVQPSKQREYVKVFPQDNCVLFPPETGEIRGHFYNRGEIFWQHTDGINICPRGFLLKDEQLTSPEFLEGYMQGNAMGTFARLHFGSNPSVVRAFLDRCRMDASKAAAVAAASASAVANAGPVAAAAAGLAAARAVTAALGESRELVAYSEDASLRTKNSSAKAGEGLTTEGTCPRHSRSLHSSPVRMQTDLIEDKDTPRRALSRSRSEIWNLSTGNSRDLVDASSSNDQTRACFVRKRTMSLTSGIDHGGINDPSASGFSSFKDGYLRQGGAPQKIVSLLPSVTEIIMRLGAGNRLVGVTDKCDKPAGVRMGRHVVCCSQQRGKAESGYKLDVPWLSKVKPDLIITQQVCPLCVIGVDAATEAIARADLRNTAMLVMDPYTVSDVWSYIIELGDILGLFKEACLIVNSFKSRLRKLAGAVSVQRSPTVLVLQSLDPLRLGGRWVAEMEMFAGAYDGLQKPGCNGEEVQWQRVTAYAPELLLLAPCASTVEQTLAEVQKLAKQPGFWSLPAVESRQVYVCDGAFFSQHGFRFVQGTELLARILHPNLVHVPALDGVLKLSLKQGQKCRPDELHRHFKPVFRAEVSNG